MFQRSRAAFLTHMEEVRAARSPRGTRWRRSLYSRLRSWVTRQRLRNNRLAVMGAPRRWRPRSARRASTSAVHWPTDVIGGLVLARGGTCTRRPRSISPERIASCGTREWHRRSSRPSFAGMAPSFESTIDLVGLLSGAAIYSARNAPRRRRGDERQRWLNGVVSNDVTKLRGRPYACALTRRER